jgi:hypothetical protein
MPDVVRATSEAREIQELLPGLIFSSMADLCNSPLGVLEHCFHLYLGL